MLILTVKFFNYTRPEKPYIFLYMLKYMEGLMSWEVVRTDDLSSVVLDELGLNHVEFSNRESAVDYIVARMPVNMLYDFKEIPEDKLEAYLTMLEIIE